MVSSHHMEGLVSDVRLSSVVPGRVTAENTVHELSNMDLVMKLHYMKAVYFFKSDAVEGLDSSDLKKPMFPLLELYCAAAGRIRRSEDGRPLIKCNDTGVRIAEAQANKTIDEWLEMNDCSLNDLLTYSNILGPDLYFSPLVFIQFTWFKCGGLSVGLSWAHILGDAFSASAFINMWGQIITGHIPTHSLPTLNSVKKSQFPSSIPEKPFSLKRVESVGDCWLTTNTSRMESHSLHITAKQLDQLLSNINGHGQEAQNIHPFQALTAIIWKSLAKVRGKSDPRIVTICTSNFQERDNGMLNNSQLISTIQVDFMVGKADTMELANLIMEKRVNESGMIEDLMERENKKSDYILYGANLTFVNLEEIYGVEIKGHNAILANYTMAGVGDEGVVLVLPGPKNGKKGCHDGRIVTMVLPDDQIVELKNELKREWAIY